MWDPYAEFETTVLDNGLTVYAAHWPGRPWQHLSVIVHSGAEADPVGKEGLAHFVEHLVSRNTRVDARAIEEKAGEQGGVANLGVTNFLGSIYAFKSSLHDQHLSWLVQAYSAMLLQAQLKSYIEEEREVVLREYSQHYANLTLFELDRARHQNLFPDHPMGRMPRPLGLPQAIAGFTAEDAQKFYDNHYTPANMSIVSLGGMPVARLIAGLQRSPFATRKEGVFRGYEPARDHHPLPTRTFRRLHWSSETCMVRAAAVVPGRFSPYLMHIFKRLFEVRLLRSLREERSWIYNLGCESIDCGAFHLLTIESHGFTLPALNAAPRLAWRELRQVSHDHDMFRRIQGQICARLSMLDSSGADVIDDVEYQVLMWRRTVSLAERQAAYRAVTIEQLCELVDYLAPQRWYLETREPTPNAAQ